MRTALTEVTAAGAILASRTQKIKSSSERTVKAVKNPRTEATSYLASRWRLQ
jgi:hypothetical protein